MISYSIPSANYRYAFPKNAENDHIDIDVVHDPGKNRYTAMLTLIPNTIGIGKRTKSKLSHPFVKVWITAPPGTLFADQCKPSESGVVWVDVQGRTAFWSVRRVFTKKPRTFSVPFQLDGAKSVRLEFGLHSDELKVPVALQYDLQGASVAPSLSAKSVAAVPKPRKSEGGMAVGGVA